MKKTKYVTVQDRASELAELLTLIIITLLEDADCKPSLACVFRYERVIDALSPSQDVNYLERKLNTIYSSDVLKEYLNEAKSLFTNTNYRIKYHSSFVYFVQPYLNEFPEKLSVITFKEEPLV